MPLPLQLFCRDKSLHSCGTTRLDVRKRPLSAHSHAPDFDNGDPAPSHLTGHAAVRIALPDPFGKVRPYRAHTWPRLSETDDTLLTYFRSTVLICSIYSMRRPSCQQFSKKTVLGPERSAGRRKGKEKRTRFHTQNASPQSSAAPYRRECPPPWAPGTSWR